MTCLVWLFDFWFHLFSWNNYYLGSFGFGPFRWSRLWPDPTLWPDSSFWLEQNRPDRVSIPIRSFSGFFRRKSVSLRDSSKQTYHPALEIFCNLSWQTLEWPELKFSSHWNSGLGKEWPFLSEKKIVFQVTIFETCSKLSIWLF